MALKSYNQGRCGALALAAAILVSLILVETVHAATYTVGDSSGWDFSMGNWVKGKKFKAGDVLGKITSTPIIICPISVYKYGFHFDFVCVFV